MTKQMKTWRVVEEEDGDAGGQQCDDVGDHEGSAAVGVRHAGEAPDVAQADGRADRGEEEADLASPLLAFGDAGLGDIGLSR